MLRRRLLARGSTPTFSPMANPKPRRKRRRGGIRGCCGMCMGYRLVDCHHRIPTRQERRAQIDEREQRR